MANMLYNGVELPDINAVWTDKTTYPYVYIFRDLYCYRLHLLTAQITPSSYSPFEFGLSGGTRYAEYTVPLDVNSDEWDVYSIGSLQWGTSYSYSSLIWSSVNVLNPDGSVYLAASTPVPAGAPGMSTSPFEAFMLGQRLRPGLMGMNTEPLMLAAQNAWYKGATDKATITSIKMVNSYTPTGNEIESWIADNHNSGAIMCYVNGTELTIAGDGNGKIVANKDSKNCFRDFTACVSIDGLTILDTSNVTTMYAMFRKCSSLTSIDLTNFDTSKVTSMWGMFYQCTALTSLDLTGFDTSKVTSIGSMFYDCDSLTSLDLTSFDTSNVSNMTGVFTSCSSLTSLDIATFDTSNVTSMSTMFNACRSLTFVDVSNFDTRNVTNMRYMFALCGSLTLLDVSNFDTSKVVDMSSMFRDCYNLETVDVSNFDTRNVTNMSWMFGTSGSEPSHFSIDVSNFDTRNVTDMQYMFIGCGTPTLDVSNFDTSNVTNMRGMFDRCMTITSLDVINFDTRNVTDMAWMFYDCDSLTSLDLTSFDVSNVADMERMFADSADLISILVSDTWIVNEDCNINKMFSNCGTRSVTYV